MSPPFMFECKNICLFVQLVINFACVVDKEKFKAAFLLGLYAILNGGITRVKST